MIVAFTIVLIGKFLYKKVLKFFPILGNRHNSETKKNLNPNFRFKSFKVI